jgi:hypothetical protein
MFAVWVSFCSVIFVQKLARKDFRTLFRYMLFFILGFSAALLPVFAYLKITRALDECIRQYIDFNIRYSSSPVMVPATFLNFARSVYLAVNKSIVPLIVCVILLLRKPAAMRYGFCIAYTLSLGLSFFFIAISRTNFGHYYMVLIPFFVPAFTLCIPPLFQLFSSVKYAWIKYGGPLFALCLFFNLPILEWGHNVFWIVRSHDKHYFRQIGEFIGANTDDEDTVFVLGNRCQYYLFSGRGAASKYIYQFPLVSVVPEIYDELCSDLYSNKPAFIIVDSVRKNEQLASVFSLIDDEYYECFQAESGRYTIYKANGAKSATFLTSCLSTRSCNFPIIRA